jgi:Mlc titration factor MtfA (ptsG expression regulator)
MLVEVVILFFLIMFLLNLIGLIQKHREWLLQRFPKATNYGLLSRLLMEPHKLTSWQRSKLYTQYQLHQHAGENTTLLIGKKIRFSDEVLHFVLQKYSPFYAHLTIADQLKFRKRTKAFYRSKIFLIHQPNPLREMPILISGAAVQLSFGLPHFKLTAYKYICIHPDAYVGYNPLRILAGNVQGSSINMSWKHFLEDYQDYSNGVNLGLHEMAHALQMQYAYFYNREQGLFNEHLQLLDSLDEQVAQEERQLTNRLYSELALANMDEFWASSVELFFEKPKALQNKYPQVYHYLQHMLQQNPAVYPQIAGHTH